MALDGNRLTIDVKDPDKENPDIVEAIVQSGGRVQSVTVAGSGLEDAYLKLVRKDR